MRLLIYRDRESKPSMEVALNAGSSSSYGEPAHSWVYITDVGPSQTSMVSFCMHLTQPRAQAPFQEVDASFQFR